MSAEQTPQLPDSALPPVKGEEYAKEMIAKGAGPEPQQQQQTEEQPKLLAGKYKTVEELEKGYAELMKQRGQTNAQQPQAQTQAKPEKTAEEKAAEEAAEAARVAALTPEQKAAEEAAQSAAEAAGLDLNKLNAEYAANGALTDESYAALEKVGITRDVVQQFIDGQKAAGTMARNEALAVVGGEEKFAELSAWAAQNVPADELASYNKIATGNDLGALKVALAGLKAKFEAANGSEPTLILGDKGSTQVGYKSKAEMVKDMADPRYAKDASFRQQVADRLKASSF